MSTPVDAIRSGLETIERAKSSPGVFKLSALAAAPSTLAEIHEITIKAAKARDRLHELRAEEIDLARKASDAITLAWKDRGTKISADGIRTDTIDGTQRRKLISEDIKSAHTERMAATADERATILAEQRAAKGVLDLVRRSWTSPVDNLMTSTLGSEKRAIFSRNLERSGPSELENAIRESVTTGNRNLAAACLARLDSIGSESRKLVQFSKTDIAEQVAGDGFVKASEAFAFADLAFEQSIFAEHEITGRGATAGAKVRIGLLKHEIEIKFGRRLDPDGKPIDAEGNPTGETFEQRLDRLYPGGPLPEGYSFVDVGGKVDGPE